VSSLFRTERPRIEALGEKEKMQTGALLALRPLWNPVASFGRSVIEGTSSLPMIERYLGYIELAIGKNTYIRKIFPVAFSAYIA